jgi:hypothetical protein
MAFSKVSVDRTAATRARERNRITADDILRAARTAEDIDELRSAV